MLSLHFIHHPRVLSQHASKYIHLKFIKLKLPINRNTWANQYHQFGFRLILSNNVIFQKLDIMLTQAEFWALLCFIKSSEVISEKQTNMDPFVLHRRDVQTLGCCQTAKQQKRENTYTEIGGYSLSPHVGGFFRVTHHLHGVHLNTKIHNEHAALTYNPGSGQEHRCKRSRFKWDAVCLQPDVLRGLCRDKGIIAAGLLPLNGPVGNTKLY